MSNRSIDILGVRINPIRITELNHQIIEHTKSKSKKQPLIIFKPYVEFLALASHDQQIRKLLNSSDINAADSTAIQWASSYLYGQPTPRRGYFSILWSLLFRLQRPIWRNQIIPERMAGVDQTLPLLGLADQQNLKIAILGGPVDTAQTQQAIQSRFPGIQLKTWTGFYRPNKEHEIVASIAKFAPDILFCAMGFPKQEKFIVKYQAQLKSKVVIGEGGSFDYDQLGGGIKRAPLWMRKIGLEWVWRLALQPSRLRRQMAIPYFIKKVYRQHKTQK